MEASKNTDKVLYEDDNYKISLTKENSLTICVGGYCVVKPIDDWHDPWDKLKRVSLELNEKVKDVKI